MGDANPIHTLGDYFKPSHEGYMNTIELLVGNNVVPLRSDTIRLVQNGCSFHGLRSEDPNQHLKDFLKLVDSLDLYGPRLYDNESWDDLRDSANPVKEISLPQDVPSTSDHRLIELENQVQLLTEAHLAPLQPTQVNKITSSCEICSGHHDTQYYMEYPEQAFVKYASSRTDEAGGALPSDTVKNPKLNVNSTTSVLSARSYPTEDPQCSTHIHARKRGQPEDTDTIAYNEERRDMPQLERDVITAVDNLGPNRVDEGIEWLDVEQPLDLVDTSHKFTASAYIDVDLPMNIMSLAYYNSIRKNGYEYRGRNFVGLGRDMHVFVGNMSYVIDFTILENIKTNIDPNLSYVIFGRPFVEIACLAINKKHGLMTFTGEIKEITFKTPYKDPYRSKLSSEGHDLLPSRVILSEDDYDRGFRKPSNLEDRFYRDTIKFGPEYLTGMDDEGEVTLYLMRRSLEVLRKFHWMILRGRFNQLSHVSSSLLSKSGEY
ncbi:hypothetical protein Tco_1485189 [Tanacetum coccineum]